MKNVGRPINQKEEGWAAEDRGEKEVAPAHLVPQPSLGSPSDATAQPRANNISS
jgi:hypothetical protein